MYLLMCVSVYLCVGIVSLVCVLAVDDHSWLLDLLVYPVPCQYEHSLLDIAVYLEKHISPITQDSSNVVN